MKKTLLLLSFLFISVAGFSQTYDIYQYNPLNPRGNDGYFLRNYNTGQIYIVFEGTTRYIQTPATLNGLFVGAANNLINVPPSVIWGYPAGTSVSQDSGFVKYTPTGQFYLREGNLLRYVTSPDVAQRYHFNFSIAVNKTSYAGYNIGSNIVN